MLWQRRFRRVISLGGACETAFQIKKHTSKDDSDYFDWLVTPFPALLGAIEGDFSGMARRQDFVRHGDGRSLVNRATGIFYFHSFPKDENGFIAENYGDFFGDFLARTAYLEEKWRATMASRGPVLFIRRGIQPSEASRLAASLSAHYRALDFSLLCVTTGPQDFEQLGDGRIAGAAVPPSGPDGVGLSQEWGKLLLDLGVTDRCDQKTYAQITRRVQPGIYGVVD